MPRKNQNIIIVFSCLPYIAHLPSLVSLFVEICGIYLKSDLESMALISILFINIL